MTLQHNPYLYGVRIEGTFYPLSYPVCEYKPYQDFGDYVEYYLEFSCVEKEYVDNIHRIKQAFYQRNFQISVEGYDEILDTYFINVSGVFDREFEYGMDGWGNLFVRIIVREYKVGCINENKL